MVTGRPIAKTLIKYIRNNLEEKDEEEKEPINIELTEQKQIHIMMKMLLTLNDKMDKEKTRKILLWLTSLKITKANWFGEFFKKLTWIIAVSYLKKRKIKKIFLEVIPNTKIFYIKFCLMKLQTTKILTNLEGIDKGDLNNVEYDTSTLHLKNFCCNSYQKSSQSLMKMWTKIEFKTLLNMRISDLNARNSFIRLEFIIYWHLRLIFWLKKKEIRLSIWVFTDNWELSTLVVWLRSSKANRHLFHSRCSFSVLCLINWS